MKNNSQSGFTLLELLVVLAIISLMIVIAAPRFAAALPGAELEAGTRQLISGLREARSKAVFLNRDIPFILSGNADSYSIGGGKGEALPKKIGITLVTGRSEITGANQGAIRFFPDGSSTGGRIELVGKNGQRTIDVDWLTGRIRSGD